LDKWYTEKIPTYYIKIDDAFKGCEEMHKWLISANTAAKN